MNNGIEKLGNDFLLVNMRIKFSHHLGDLCRSAICMQPTKNLGRNKLHFQNDGTALGLSQLSSGCRSLK